MKQTNNALKYLLAQYRAIFKNAYFKGLVSAAVLTAGLAGVVQPAVANTISTWQDLKSKLDEAANNTVVVDGTDISNIRITSVTDTTLNGTIEINSGTASDNSTSGNLLQGASGSITGSLNLIIDSKTHDAKDVGLAITSNTTTDGDTYKIDIGSINVRQGGLGLAMGMSAQSGDLIVTAKTIDIGLNKTFDSTNTVDKIAATVSLGGGAGSGYSAPSDGSITFGNGYDADTKTAASVTTLNKSGIIKFFGDDTKAEKIVFEGQLIGKGGKLDFTSGSGTIKAYGTDVNANMTVGADQKAVVSLTDSLETETINEGLLQFTSGMIDVQGKGSGTAGGQIVVSGGVLEVIDKTVLTSSVAGGTTAGEVGSILVSGASADAPATFRTSSQKVLEFLNANEISKDNTDYAAGIVLSGTSIGQSVLEFTDTTQVDLYALVTDDPNDDNDLNITIKNDDSVSGGVLAVSGGTIKATNLAVTNGSDKLTLDKAFLEADDLTLGSKDYDPAGTDTITISGSTVHNSLTLSTKDNAEFVFTSGTHTLDAAYYDSQLDEDGNWISNTVASTHYINGVDFQLSGSAAVNLKVTGGTWSTKGQDITLGKNGSLTVATTAATADAGGSSPYQNDGNPATLIVDGGDLTIGVGSDSGSIAVTGASGANATLDLRNVNDVTFTSGSITVSGSAIGVGSSVLNNEQFEAFYPDAFKDKVGYGVLKINQKTFDEYVDQTGSNGVTLFVDGGGIVEVSDLRTAQYDVNTFSGGASAGNKGIVVLDADAYFVVNGDLNLYDGMDATGTSEKPENGAATDVSGLNIGSGTIIADRVNLTIYGRDTVTVGDTDQQVVSDAKFVAGTVEVSEGFTTNSSTLVLGADNSGATIVLDADIGNTGTLMGTGARTIEMVGGDSNGESGGKINIVTGAWGQEQLDLSASGYGTGLTVGSTDGELIEQAQALSTDEATVYVAQYIGDNFAGTGASGNVLTVNKQSQAVFNTIQLGDSSSVDVYGHLLINGLNVQNPGDDATDPAYVNPDDDDTYSTTAGISLGAANFTVSGPTANVEFGSTATAALVNLTGDPDDDNNDKSTISLTEGGINTTQFVLNEFGHLTLNFASGTAVNADDAKFFTTKFLGSSDETAYLVLNNADLDIQYETRDDGLYEVTWDNLKPFVNIVGSQATTDKLKQALVSHIGAGEAIKGHYGAASVDAASTTALSLNGATSFSNAAAFGGQFVTSERDGKVMGVQFTNDYTSLSLENGGTIGAIKGAGVYGNDYNSLYVTSPAGALTTIAGSVTEINDFTVDSETEVNGEVAVEYLDLGANLTTTATNQGVTINEGVVRSNATLTTDSLTIGGANANTYYGQVDVLGTIHVTGTDGITINSSARYDGSLALFGGYVSASALTLDQNSYVAVGYEPSTGQQDDPTTDYIDESQSYTGFLEITGTTTLNGGSLVLDPEYGQATAMASLNDLYRAPADKTSLVAGTLDGNVFVGQNSALGIHSDSMTTLQSKVARFQNGQTLVEDNIGAVTYLGGSFTVGAGQGLILTKYTLEEFADDYNQRDGVTVDQLTEDTVVTSSLFDDTVFLGANTALLIDADVMHTAAQGRNNAVITFAGSAGVNNGTGTVIADGGEIVIDGDVRASTYQVFSNAVIKYIDGTAYAVAEEGAAHYAENINVTTENDFLQGVVDTTGAVTLGVNPNGRTIMRGASDPVYASLVAYARGYNGAEPTAEEVTAHPVAAESGYTQIAGVSDDRLLYSYNDNGDRVYGQYSNYFLQETISTGDGSAAETVARLATFGGAVQAAITAGASSYEAISGRMGMGATGYNLTVADNTQGAALWVSPLYKSSESDSFDAEGVDYGVDLNLYGVALGADYTLANGVSFGAMFNVGSGDVDGKDAGSAVSNDFDYYGFGVYGGYSVDNFKVVADLTYTVADNDLEGNTAIDKVGASLDTSNLSFGVTAQYAFDFTGATVTPHAGLRYSYIDMDDYDVDGEGTVATYDGDSLGIFSIPVGVTIAKEFVGDNWSVKPSFDLTLTGNFGDDETDGTVHWAGVENLSTNVSSEFIDNFTYGATLGVAAKTGNFSLGLGVNYTGSSNTDEYGVNANARFVF